MVTTGGKSAVIIHSCMYKHTHTNNKEVKTYQIPKDIF